MSGETAELVQRAFDALNHRDQEAFLALMDEDVVAESRLAAVEGGYRGHDGIRRWWDDLLGMLPDYAIELDEVRELGDVTLTRFHERGHGATSGSPLLGARWQPSRWRAGRCVWWRVCASEAEALEAIGAAG